MTTTSKPLFPTTTTHTIRLALFQATRRPKAQRGVVIDTPWGKIKVWGRLGQAHADLFEAICYEREKKAELDDGRIKLLVDPARVRARAGITGGRQLDQLIIELQEAVIEIIEPAHLACIGHIVDHVDTAMRSDGTPITRRNPLGGTRELWRVEVGKAFCKLVAHDVWIGYDPAPIAQLRHGISQAVARHVLSHKTQPAGGWHIDTLIKAVAGGSKEQQLRDRRRELRQDAEKLASLRIIVEANRIRFF